MSKHHLHHSMILWTALFVNGVGVLLLAFIAAENWTVPSAIVAPQVLAVKERGSAIGYLEAGKNLLFAQATTGRVAAPARYPMVATTTFSVIRATEKLFTAEQKDTKETLWTFVLPENLKYGWADPVVVNDRMILVPTYNTTYGKECRSGDCTNFFLRQREPSYLYALETRTGNVLWKTELDGPSPARYLEKKDDRAYIGTENGYWYTIRVIDTVTGALQWKTEINEERI